MDFYCPDNGISYGQLNASKRTSAFLRERREFSILNGVPKECFWHVSFEKMQDNVNDIICYSLDQVRLRSPVTQLKPHEP